MNYKELSAKYKAIKSPAKQQQLSDLNATEKNSLLETIKEEDANSKKQSKRFYIITSIAAIVYVLLFIVNPDPDLTIKNRIAGSCYVVASLILAILFWKKHNQIKQAWYLASPKVFLNEAKKRFQFWNWKQLWLIVVVLLVNVATMVSLSKYFEYLNNVNGIIVFQLIYFSLLAFGFIMGKKDWQKNKKPILLKIEKMLAGFDEEK
jgi:hypothetical protein